MFSSHPSAPSPRAPCSPSLLSSQSSLPTASARSLPLPLPAPIGTVAGGGGGGSTGVAGSAVTSAGPAPGAVPTLVKSASATAVVGTAWTASGGPLTMAGAESEGPGSGAIMMPELPPSPPPTGPVFAPRSHSTSSLGSVERRRGCLCAPFAPCPIPEYTPVRPDVIVYLRVCPFVQCQGLASGKQAPHGCHLMGARPRRTRGCWTLRPRGRPGVAVQRAPAPCRRPGRVLGVLARPPLDWQPLVRVSVRCRMGAPSRPRGLTHCVTSASSLPPSFVLTPFLRSPMRRSRSPPHPAAAGTAR